MRKICCI